MRFGNHEALRYGARLPKTGPRIGYPLFDYVSARKRSINTFGRRLMGGGVMLSDAMQSVARRLGLSVVPYQSDLGFTAVRENNDRFFVFVLNSGEWSIYRAADVVLAENGSGPASFEMALRQHLGVSEARNSAA